VATGWQEKKYDCYSAYVNEVKAMSIIIRRMAAYLELTERSADKLSPEKGASLLTEAETRRSVASENLRLLSDSDTVAAASKLDEAVWLLEWIVRGKIDEVTSDKWPDADAAFAHAFDTLHFCARRELGVPGQAINRRFISAPTTEGPEVP
jgi:hypothetical protein